MDRSKTWESVNERLPRRVNSWEFVKPSVPLMLTLVVADGTLYAGIRESGVYRIALDNPDSD